MVMRMKYKFNEEQCFEICEARKKNRDKQTETRLKVLERRSKGKGLDKIASETGFQQSHVSNLIRLCSRLKLVSDGSRSLNIVGAGKAYAHLCHVIISEDIGMHWCSGAADR